MLALIPRMAADASSLILTGWNGQIKYLVSVCPGQKQEKVTAEAVREGNNSDTVKNEICK